MDNNPTQNPHDDRYLVEIAQKELPYVTLAYTELMQRYERKLFLMTMRMLGNESDAQDVTQNILIKVFNNLKKFESRSLFKTWLYRIAINECNSFIRSQQKHKENIANTDVQEVELPAKEPYSKVDRIYLQQLLSLVSKNDREVLILRFIGDLNLNEIAEITDSGLSATKMRLYRAIENLRKIAKNKSIN